MNIGELSPTIRGMFGYDATMRDFSKYLLVAILLTGTAQAGGNDISPGDTQCAAAMKVEAVPAWIAAYMQTMNDGSGDNIYKMTLPITLGWVSKWCESNPQATVFDAMWKLTSDKIEKRNQ
ncbi:MAG: hypothetical protein HQ503_14080 [Rhodospirillales bacterium]|nr:hypothetical protein [Rhodospirillales bacterium]